MLDIRPQLNLLAFLSDFLTCTLSIIILPVLLTDNRLTEGLSVFICHLLPDMAHFMVLMVLTHQFNLNLPTSAKTEILFSIIRLCLFSSLFY